MAYCDRGLRVHTKKPWVLDNGYAAGEGLMAERMADSVTGKLQSQPRPCGDCSLCCEGWLKTRVMNIQIDVGKPCPHCSGHHCTIHADRPRDPCRIFFCGWAVPDSPLPDWLHPSECGVIVLTDRSSWRGKPVDVLVSAGKDPDERLLQWYRHYSINNLRPFIYQNEGMWFGFGPMEFQREIAAKARRGEQLWI